MKLLPILILAFALSLGVACSSEPAEPSFEEAVAKRVAEKKIEEAAAAQIEAEAKAAAEAEAAAKWEAEAPARAKREANIKAVRAKEYAEEQAQPYIDDGLEHFRNAEYELALEAYSEAVRLHPQDDETFWSIGRLYYRLGEYETAISAFTEAINLAFRSEWPYSLGSEAMKGFYHRDRGHAYSALGNTAMAEEDYETSVYVCTHHYEVRMKTPLTGEWAGMCDVFSADGSPIGYDGFSPPTPTATPTR